jgi:hypothetical protein
MRFLYKSRSVIFRFGSRSSDPLKKIMDLV